MTLRDLIATALQLMGVYLGCEVIANGMSYTVFGNMSGGELTADWMHIWMINIAIWAIGLVLSISLILFAAKIAALMVRLTKTNGDPELKLVGVTSDVFVQVFAILLLVCQSYYAVNALVNAFRFGGLGDGFLIPIALYFIVTIALSAWLLRYPNILCRLRGSRAGNKDAEQVAAPHP